MNFKEGDIARSARSSSMIEEDGAARAARGNGNGRRRTPSSTRPRPDARVRARTPRAARRSGAAPAAARNRGRRRDDEPRARARDAGDAPARAPARRRDRPRAGDRQARPRHDRGRQELPGQRRAREQPAQHAPVSIAKGGDEERIPLRGMRKKIAEAMSRSVHTAAHFTYVEEVDMTELVAVRERAKARAAERGVKLNYLPFIVKACVSGLKKWPQLNAIARRGDAGDRAQAVLPHRHRGAGPAGARGLGRPRRGQAVDLRSVARRSSGSARPCAPARRRATS